MNPPQGDTPTKLPHAALTSKVSELLHICAGLGLAPPEFNYMSNQQVARVAQTATRRKELLRLHQFVFQYPDVFTGSRHLSGEVVQWVDGSWPTVPDRK